MNYVHWHGRCITIGAKAMINAYLIGRKWITLGLLLVVLCGLVLSQLGTLQSQQPGPTTVTLPVQILPAGQANTSQTQWSFTGTGAASAVTLTQPAVSGKFNWCTGFEITGAGATGASVITVTLASGGTTIGNYNITVPAGATTTITPLIVQFNPPLQGLATGSNMVLTTPSFGAGNTNSAVTFHGFNQ